jgi:hypothetical protein
MARKKTITKSGRSAPPLPHRIVMLDPARLMERKAEYLALLPWLRRWGYNALHLHFADDEGCRVVLPSHPELASDNAWTPDELRALLAAARREGLRVIPEIECLGHTRFITRCARHAKLGANPAQGFSAIDPRKPAVRKLLATLLCDVAELFDDPWLHVGLDEVNLRALPRCRNLDEAAAREMFIEHAAWTHEQVRCLGRRPAMWGDHLLMHKTVPAVIERDVLVFDWHYHQEDTGATIASFCRQGFEVIAAPSTMCWLSRVVTNAGNLTNLRHFTAAALLHTRRGTAQSGRVIGAANTVWCPYRHLPGAMDYPMALAGHVFSSAAEADDFAVDFAREFYGLPLTEARRCAAAVIALHDMAPAAWAYDAMVLGASNRDAFNREHVRMGRVLADRIKPIIADLARARRAAKRNEARLHDVELSARILERVGRFAAAHRRMSALPSGAALWNACGRAWRRGRACGWEPDAIMKSPGQFLMPTLRKLS